MSRAVTASGAAESVQPIALGDGLPRLHGLRRPRRPELVSSTAWADGPITQTYVAR